MAYHSVAYHKNDCRLCMYCLVMLLFGQVPTVTRLGRKGYHDIQLSTQLKMRLLRMRFSGIRLLVCVTGSRAFDACPPADCILALE